MPLIAFINESTATTDSAGQGMIPAFATQLNRDLPTLWSTEQVQTVFVSKGQTPPSGSWWCVFLDNSDQAGALAYHDLTSEGLPISKVFVKTLQADKASVSVGASHELCEMMVDPWLNSAYQDAKGIFWAGECADPVEDDQYGYTIDNVLVTDFVGPKWFGYEHESGPVDFQSHAGKAFAVLSGGYAQEFGKHGWKQITGEAAQSFARATAADGSRRERRARGRAKWKRSAPSFTAR